MRAFETDGVAPHTEFVLDTLLESLPLYGTKLEFVPDLVAEKSHCVGGAALPAVCGGLWWAAQAVL